MTFQYSGLHNLDMYCISGIMKCMHISLVLFTLNVRDKSKSKYHSIVFLCIVPDVPVQMITEKTNDRNNLKMSRVFDL